MLVTDRLRLDPVAARDAEAFLGLFRDEGVRRFLLDDSLIGPGWVEREIEASHRRFARGSVGLYAARFHRNDELIGLAGLRPARAPDDLEILYAVDPAMAGKGLASEMVAAVLDHAFDLSGLPMVRATIDVPNRASIKLVERLGFALVGRRPAERFELLVYEIDAATWRRRPE